MYFNNRRIVTLWALRGVNAILLHPYNPLFPFPFRNCVLMVYLLEAIVKLLFIRLFLCQQTVNAEGVIVFSFSHRARFGIKNRLFYSAQILFLILLLHTTFFFKSFKAKAI